MNWTDSGVKKNDENCMVIRNHEGLGKAMEDQFQGSFASLPDITLFSYFSAEGLNSVGSMVDGSDNDHFGGKDPFISWQNYNKALGEIDTAAHKMAAVQGNDAALQAKIQALDILNGEVAKAEVRLQTAQGTKADMVIQKINQDIQGKIKTPML
jgi:hypothetical protein